VKNVEANKSYQVNVERYRTLLFFIKKPALWQALSNKL